MKYDLDNHVIAVDGSKFDLEWYRKNYLDCVYAVSDDSGDRNEHYRYTAFGEVTIYNNCGTVQSSSQINNQIMWNTRRLDEVSGYYLYKYRHYSPALGRWQMADGHPET
ncbi:MAG: RHS repeat-associated protein [Rubritalea sp.]